jgi:hypothetical protein
LANYCDARSIVEAPFPTIEYCSKEVIKTKQRTLITLAKCVDSIMGVAFVVPTFYEKEPRNHFETTFYNVPIQFLMRGEFGDMDFEEQIRLCVSNDILSKKYLTADKTTKDTMLANLLRSLKNKK